MHRFIHGADVAAVRKARAAKLRSVGSKHLFVNARVRHADAVILAADRQEIAHGNQLVALTVKAAERNDALAVVVVRDPREALPREIDLPQLGTAEVERVELFKERLRHLVLRVLQQIPLEFFVKVPLVVLRELRAHKLQFFARVCHHVGRKAAYACSLFLRRARHLIIERTLAVDDLIVRDRQNEILGERIEERERQAVVVALSKQRIQRHVAQHVVHPAHVPFIIESETAHVSRLRHHRPRGAFFGNHHDLRHLGKNRLVQSL